VTLKLAVHRSRLPVPYGANFFSVFLYCGQRSGLLLEAGTQHWNCVTVQCNNTKKGGELVGECNVW